MSRELLIMRHGESGWQRGEADFGRTLTEWGRRDVGRMGEWLLAQDLLPQRVVCSPALRTVMTADRVCTGMGQAGRSVQQDERIYEASLEQLLAVVADSPPACERLLLIGHNPGLGQLLLWLAGMDAVQAQAGAGMPPGALAVLRLPGEWQALSPGDARLVSIGLPSTV